MWRKLADIKIIKREDDPFDAVIEECVIDNSKIIRLQGKWRFLGAKISKKLLYYFY